MSNKDYPIFILKKYKRQEFLDFLLVKIVEKMSTNILYLLYRLKRVSDRRTHLIIETAYLYKNIQQCIPLGP